MMSKRETIWPGVLGNDIADILELWMGTKLSRDIVSLLSVGQGLQVQCGNDGNMGGGVAVCFSDGSVAELMTERHVVMGRWRGES